MSFDPRLTDEERARLAQLPRGDWGLRRQDPIERDAHIGVLMRCAQLWRDGIRLALPQIPRGRR
jgi:hypothetical protein